MTFMSLRVGHKTYDVEGIIINGKCLVDQQYLEQQIDGLSTYMDFPQWGPALCHISDGHI